MFVRQCTSCRKRQLIFPSMIDAVDGTVVCYTCWCGSAQTMDTAELASPTPQLVAA